MDSLIGKRKKPRLKCANPLFEQWLEEWKNEAAEKGWKSQYIYSKALKSLRLFPIYLATGKDCKILQNFGDKICKMLDDKLAEHVAAHGTDSLGTHSAESAGEYGYDDKSKEGGIFKKGYKEPSIHVENRPHPMDTFGSSLMESDDNAVDAQPKTKRRRKSSDSNKVSKEYVPAFRSGPYAILLALYRNMQHPDTRGFMMKNEIIKEAQPLADKSFTLPDPGCRYTSWSSMGTLLKKGLIIKESSPAKYSLTDDGCQLAARLESVNTDVPRHNATAARVPPLTCFDQQGLPVLQTNSHSVSSLHHGSHSMSDSEEESEPVHCFPDDEPNHVHVPTSREPILQYWYVTEDCRLVTRKDEAAVLIDDVLSIGFLVKTNYNSLTKSGKRYKLDNSKRHDDHFVYAYLHDSDAVDIALPPPEKDLTTNKRRQGANEKKSAYATASGKSRTTSSSSSTSTSATSLRDRQLSLEPKIGRDTGSRPVTTESQVPSIKEYSLPSSQASSVKSSASSLPPPDFFMHPGTFDVVLCVDNREFYGGSSQKTLLPDLIKNGVECDLRELQIGDMLWIARERVQPVPGQLERPKGKELVLDFIIERKRMDDLVSSMIDGRFREQKFRLKRSGIANAIYLIEDHGSMQHFSVAEERIKQAIVNTQVIDDFKVKRTSGVKETVAYLTVITRYLQSFYRNKTLQACTPEMLRELEESFHIEEAEKLLTPFEHFNQASVKSKDLSVRELFGKQLIQLHGMSADKAKAITDMYQTPESLFAAYDRCPTLKGKESLLANIKAGKGMRNLGATQSKQIQQLYCTNSPLT